jgi:DMSO/TMAO reductase YedYZ molybdopterin-dependent catalytic subunit
MADHFVSRGFVPKRRDLAGTNRIPPGQYLVRDFPVLSAGPTPRTPLDHWTFTIEGLVAERMQWTWQEFMALPMREFTVDIHCVTKWSKLNTVWRGISLDDLFEQVELSPQASFLTAYCDGDYTTNLPLPDVLNGQAFIACEFDGRPLTPEHGGPARLVVPHLYFWKSAKWIRGLHLMEHDKRGFWESLGYHNHGDPWKEQRYSADE